jgi:hypothetical protein
MKCPQHSGNWTGGICHMKRQRRKYPADGNCLPIQRQGGIRRQRDAEDGFSAGKGRNGKNVRRRDIISVTQRQLKSFRRKNRPRFHRQCVFLKEKRLLFQIILLSIDFLLEKI